MKGYQISYKRPGVISAVQLRLSARDRIAFLKRRGVVKETVGIAELVIG
jgi:hypothetical protein